ncbi:maleylpyruvate isomerase N-terminal domain-containing protein [Nocardioides dongkuii]|uniref:maleylpyruvate isomerase N-terminal domain-containing protein n=1 Tax=Nocardioides dongkuii TaxID=2760089 RepID=UPI0015F7FD27|nr:maleylpyruvate isomerase N-terminal domain-containing protein [Nocardioides dongkuii]
MVIYVIDVRAAYLQAAREATALIGSPAIAEAWAAESALPGMSVGALASHLARSVLQVEWFLDGPVTGTEPVSAVDYYARLVGTRVPDSPLNIGVRARSNETAATGPAAVADEARAALDRLRERLGDEPADRRVAVLHRPGEEMLLDDYLQTRCVELAVHIEDLGLSACIPVQAPPAATAIAVELLVAAARARHGDHEVLQALSRRERDDNDALRVV